MTQKNDPKVQTVYNHRHYKYDEPSVSVRVLYKGVPVFEGDYFKRAVSHTLMRTKFDLYFYIEDCIIEAEFARLLADEIANDKIHNPINEAFLKQKGNQET